MNYKHFITIILVTTFLSSCLGDRKQVDISEMNDINFVNNNFKNNLINYSEDMSACDQISTAAIASLYNVAIDEVIIQDISKSNQRVPSSPPSCGFYIKTGKNDFEWLRGSMNVQREIAKDEMAYEVAKAAGNGEEWEEAWALQKSISKSAEWINGIGMAALWIEAKKELRVKFKGYTLYVFPIKNKLNKAEVAKNRNYKEAAVAMVKAAGYIK